MKCRLIPKMKTFPLTVLKWQTTFNNRRNKYFIIFPFKLAITADQQLHLLFKYSLERCYYG